LQEHNSTSDEEPDVDRKTAIAAALAITMSVASGAVALGANAGALGFGGSTPVASTQSIVVPAAGPIRSVAAKAAVGEGEHDDGARSVQISADASANYER
jgi:hypothetical protein